MAIVETSVPGTSVGPPETVGPQSTRPRKGRWAWVIAGCLLLGTSGGVRAWQDRRFEQEKGYLEDCPFPLATMPKSIGAWRIVEGSDVQLDTLTVRITGSTEHFQRLYVDELTGVTLGVLVLFGPAEPVLPHTPQVCYPATGHQQIEEPADRIVTAEDGRKDRFRTAVYGKSGGRAIVRTEVYHSYRLDGIWSPDVGVGRKFPRKNPGIFKVQVYRLVTAGERRDRDNPIEQFLSVLIPEIERRIADGQAKAGKSPSPTAPDRPSTPGPGPSAMLMEIGRPGGFAHPDRDSEPLALL